MEHARVTTLGKWVTARDDERENGSTNPSNFVFTSPAVLFRDRSRVLSACVTTVNGREGIRRKFR